MPSLLHESLVSLFRDCPALAPELLRHTGSGDLLGQTTPHLTSAELADLDPAEYRADVVIRMDAGDNNPTEVIIVEVQLARDPEKRFTWPLYMTGMRVRFRCPARLLVIAVDDSVAAWCAQPIPLDRGKSEVHPLVLGPRELPRITDFEQAREFPELAVLSAAAHGNEENAAEIAVAALSACQWLDRPRSTRYADFVLSSLSEAAQRALEALMNLHKYEYQSEFAKRYVEEGREEGRKDDRRAVLIELLSQRFGDIPDAIRERIEQAEMDQLELWTKRVIPAATVADVFKEE